MGNENSAQPAKNPKTTVKPSLKKTSAPDNYKPPVLVNDKKQDNLATQSKNTVPQESSTPHFRQVTSTVPVVPIVNKELSSAAIPLKKPVALVPTIEHSFSVLSPKPRSSVQEEQQPLHDIPLSNTINRVAASSLEKAPVIQLNYVVRSSDNKSIPTYGPGNITVMRRVSSQNVSYGTRWYDYDYNKNTQPLIVKYP